MSEVVIGVDVGSSRIKVVAFGSDGRARSSAGAPMPALPGPSDRVEVDMDATWAVVRRLLRDTVEALAGSEIAGIGVTAAGAGLWATRDDGRPSGPAIIWNDGRAADLMLTWMRTGVTDRLSELSSNVVMPGYPLPLLAWMSQHDPDAFDRIDRIHFAKDWIGYCLTGEWTTDPSDASLGLIDQDRGGWSAGIEDAAGVDGVFERLPSIRPATEVRGVVHDELAAELGLRAGCIVSVGLMDVAATALGAGSSQIGDACTILGTSAINGVLTDTPHLPPAGIGQVIAMPEGVWLKTLVNTSGTQALEWAVSLLDDGSGDLSASGVEQLAADSVDGANGALFHPYLSLAGSIAPFVHPGARGNLFGLSATTTRPDIARAVFEGVALAIAECYSAMTADLRAVRLAGGGARSGLWRRLIADLLEVDVLIPGSTELGARGAAMTASVAAGLHSSLAEVRAAWIDEGSVESPDPSRAAVLASRRPLFRQLAESFADPWSQLLRGGTR